MVVFFLRVFLDVSDNLESNFLDVLDVLDVSGLVIEAFFGEEAFGVETEVSSSLTVT